MCYFNDKDTYKMSVSKALLIYIVNVTLYFTITLMQRFKKVHSRVNTVKSKFSMLCARQRNNDLVCKYHCLNLLDWMPNPHLFGGSSASLFFLSSRAYLKKPCTNTYPAPALIRNGRGQVIPSYISLFSDDTRPSSF